MLSDEDVDLSFPHEVENCELEYKNDAESYTDKLLKRRCLKIIDDLIELDPIVLWLVNIKSHLHKVCVK